MNPSTTMQAAKLEAYGQPFRLATIARPRAEAGQVLVRIAASGANPLDSKIRAGAAAHARHPTPAILGLDMAGTVEDLGEGVTRFRRGDEVYGMTGGVGGHQGSLAQFAAVDADLLALKPANLSLREAAAVPLVFITAWEGLVDRARLQGGQTVLVQGGAGGVGAMAIQITKAFGADVVATGSPASRALIERTWSPTWPAAAGSTWSTTRRAARLSMRRSSPCVVSAMWSAAWAGERTPWPPCPSRRRPIPGSSPFCPC